jgi:hypothetical protein
MGAVPAGSGPGGHRFIVDHLEGDVVVGELLGGGRVDLPRWLLPTRLQAGDVVAFERLETAGDEMAFRVRFDEEATRAGSEEAATRLARLRRQDPGGDLAL